MRVEAEVAAAAMRVEAGVAAGAMVVATAVELAAWLSEVVALLAQVDGVQAAAVKWVMKVWAAAEPVAVEWVVQLVEAASAQSREDEEEAVAAAAKVVAATEAVDTRIAARATVELMEAEVKVVALAVA